MRRALIVCATALAMCWSAAASANPADEFGMGARQIALGGAGTSNATDFSANYYNPAGLAAANDLRLDLGYIYVDPTLRINGGDTEVDRPYGVQGGVVMPGELFGHALAVSMGAYVPAERITRIRALNQAQPRFALYDNRPQRLIITSSLGFELVENLYVGAGLTYLSDTRGTLALNGYVHFEEVERTALFSAVDVNLESIRYASAGILWTPGDRWRFGFSFRDEFALDLELGVDVTADIYSDLLSPDGTSLASGAFVVVVSEEVLFSPRQFTWGLTYDHGPWMATADLTWSQWSRFPAPAALIDLTLDLDLPIPIALPPVSEPLPPEFHDIFIPRFGFEWRIVQQPSFLWAARFGYFYQPTPAPDQPGLTNYIDSTRHGLSFGFGFEFADFSEVFPRPIQLDFAMQYIRLNERDYVKDDAADPVGDYTADGHFLGGSFNLSFLF